MLILRAVFLYCAIDPHIRHANRADAPAIAEFNIRLARETEQLALDPDRVARGVEALLADPAKGLYFVAESGGAVTGQLLLTHEWSDWRNGTFWWIQSVYVEKAWRGRGVFRALFNHVRDLAQSRGDVCGLRLYMDSGNGSARGVYEKLGMKPTNYELYELDFVLPHRQAVPEKPKGTT